MGESTENLIQRIGTEARLGAPDAAAGDLVQALNRLEKAHDPKAERALIDGLSKTFGDQFQVKPSAHDAQHSRITVAGREVRYDQHMQKWQAYARGDQGNESPADKPTESRREIGSREGEPGLTISEMRGGATDHQPRDNTKTFEKPRNYYGELDKLSPEQLNKLAVEHTSLVLPASQCTEANIAKLKAANSKLQIEAYISSSGFTQTDDGKQIGAFKEYLFKPKPDGAGLNKAEYPDDKLFLKQPGATKFDALRVNETNDTVHEAYRQYLVKQAGQMAKNGVGGVFIDDFDTTLNKQRDDARGLNGGTADLNKVCQYQRGINNHIDTVAALQAAFKQENPNASVTLNRGQDYTQDGNHGGVTADGGGGYQNVNFGSKPEDWKLSADGKTIEPNWGSQNNDKNHVGSEANKAAGELNDIFGGKTDRVMFEGINNPSDAEGYQNYLKMISHKNPNAAIEFTAYRSAPAKPGEEPKDLAHGYVTEEEQRKNIDAMLKGLSTTERNWALKQMVVHTYDDRELSKAKELETLMLEEYLKTHPSLES